MSTPNGAKSAITRVGPAELSGLFRAAVAARMDLQYVTSARDNLKYGKYQEAFGFLNAVNVDTDVQGLKAHMPDLLADVDRIIERYEDELTRPNTTTTPSGAATGAPRSKGKMMIGLLMACLCGVYALHHFKPDLLANTFGEENVSYVKDLPIVNSGLNLVSTYVLENPNSKIYAGVLAILAFLGARSEKLRGVFSVVAGYLVDVGALAFAPVAGTAYVLTKIPAGIQRSCRYAWTKSRDRVGNSFIGTSGGLVKELLADKVYSYRERRTATVRT